MPRLNIKPVVKLSKAQWKALIERTVQKEGRLTRGAADEILKYEPPVQKEMGILHQDVPLGAGESRRVSEMLPLREAREKYFSMPDMYTNPSQGAPATKSLRTVPPGNPDELAGGLAYEKLNINPIVPYTNSPSERAIRKVLTPQQEAGGAGEVMEATATQELVSHALNGDEMWKMMVGRAGNRSLAAKTWEALREGSRQKSQYDSGRDYFMATYVRWKKDPTRVLKNNPREANLLQQMEQILEAPIE